MRLATAERFLRWVREDESGCWIWTGYVAKSGYGYINDKRSLPATMSVHRFSYRLFKGVIPDGLDLDHLCRVRACCNPGHLEAVSRRENLVRSPLTYMNKTHCKWGHEFTPANTRLKVKNKERGWTSRSCRACEARRAVEAKEKKRGV